MKKMILIMAILILVGCSYVNREMIWSSDIEYGVLDIVLVYDGYWYETYCSLSDHNKGNYPPTHPDLWGQ
jgi:hypothetical protein